MSLDLPVQSMLNTYQIMEYRPGHRQFVARCRVIDVGPNQAVGQCRNRRLTTEGAILLAVLLPTQGKEIV